MKGINVLKVMLQEDTDFLIKYRTYWLISLRVIVPPFSLRKGLPDFHESVLDRGAGGVAPGHNALGCGKGTIMHDFHLCWGSSFLAKNLR